MLNDNSNTSNSKNRNRLFLKVSHDNIPQVKDKYPFLYLERGRLEIDDASVKWIDCDGSIVRLPVATLNCLLLGPGTSITHDAVKTIAQTNCGVCWVGEDGLLFYASGQSPTSNTRNMRQQMQLSCDPKKSLEVCKRMFAMRFPDADLTNKTLPMMMGMEGQRVRTLYEQKSSRYGVKWSGRQFTHGNFELSDLTNKILTSLNATLYGIISSVVHSLGYSPHIGFIHSGSPLPFIYDIADLYKETLCIDLAFSLTFEMAGEYNKYLAATKFMERVISTNLLQSIGRDIESVLGVKHVSSDSQ